MNRTRWIAVGAVWVSAVCAFAAEDDLAGTWRSSERADDVRRALDNVVTSVISEVSDTYRFGRLRKRIDEVHQIRVVTIGGSITEGARASCLDNRWTNRFVALLQRQFPGTRFELVNAGVGATGSQIGAARLKRDVLALRPDLVIVEFSVNDESTRESAESYEGILRQLMGDGCEVTVMCLGMMDQRGMSAQEWHKQVARHYHVPFVSYRDVVWPLIEADKIRWSDIASDGVHPNDVGHDMAAQLLFRCLMANLGKQNGVAGATLLPRPLFGAAYEHGEFVKVSDLVPTENKGFFPLKDRMWGRGLACTNTNGCLSFAVDAPTIAILYRRGRDPYQWGKVRISIDGKVIAEALDCFSDQWWWKTPALFLCKNEPGKHVIRIETLPEKSDSSRGYGCHLTGFLVYR